MPLSPHCLDTLHLQQSPFDALPSESFVFSDPLLDKVIQCALSCLEYPNAVVLLTGPGGSGLSTQLMRILSCLPQEQLLVPLRARNNTRYAAIDRSLRDQLRIRRGIAKPDESLLSLLGEQMRIGLDLTIAIDDAHLLGTDILSMFLRLSSEILREHGKTMRILLCGSPVLLQRRIPINQEARDRLGYCSLKPFSPEQTEGYLRTRLLAAGCPNIDSLLTPEALTHLQEQSTGLAARINEAADAWLSSVCAERTSCADSPTNPPQYAQSRPMTPGNVDSALVHPPESTPLDLKDREEPTIPPLSSATEPSETFSGIARENVRPETVMTNAWDAPSQDTKTKNSVEDEPDERVLSGRPSPYTTREEQDRFWNQRWFVPTIAVLVAMLILFPILPRLLDRDRKSVV